LNGFKWVQEDGTMLISMVEMSTKKQKKSRLQKRICAHVHHPWSSCTNNRINTSLLL